MRRRNPVRDMILRKLSQTEEGVRNGRVEEMMNLEALVDVIFERAKEKRGRVPIEAARLLFEYAVGKPKMTMEIEDLRDAEGVQSREELQEELEGALRQLGIEGAEDAVFVRAEEGWVGDGAAVVEGGGAEGGGEEGEEGEGEEDGQAGAGIGEEVQYRTEGF